MIWDDDANFPARDADFGIAQERAMRDVAGGYGGIRTVEWQEPDGSWARLRTRGGNPVFERDGDGSAGGAPDQAQRGFVAQVPGGRAVLFNPYTLAILQSPYTPAAKPYFVESFATAWNVPTGDTTHWYDVVLFDGTTIKVNAKAMPVLQIAADHGFPAIPYLISRHDTSDQYGNAERNGYEKRVFAAGRYSVKSWGGGGAVETLTPTTPRSDGKAMTIGPRIDPATNKAYLGQLFFTADAWDDSGAEWGFSAAEVAMLLTAPYLTKVSTAPSVPMTPLALTNQGGSSGSMVTDTTLPATGIGMRCTGVVSYRGPYNSYSLPLRLAWPWGSVVQSPLAGRVDAAYLRVTYGSPTATTETVVSAGCSLTYSGVNTKNFDIRTESTSIKAQVIPYSSKEPMHASVESLSTAESATKLIWGDIDTGRGPADIVGRTKGYAQYSPWIGMIPGSNGVSREYKTQVGDFSVSIGSDFLIQLHFWRERSSGGKATFVGRTDSYDVYIANPWGWIGPTSGIGVGNTAELTARTFPGNDDATPVLWYKATGGDPAHRSQTPEVIAEINAFVDEMAAAYTDLEYFGSENDSGTANPNLYYTSISPSVSLDDSALTWNTKDYLLYDAVNGVFITIEGSFIGANTSATLTVTLKVQTRAHTVVQTLGVYNYTYSDLLPEVTIDVGRTAIPSPQIRVIFAPLYCEQGTFKGAHYVTAAEEANGATPFHGFNFILRLKMYGDLATLNQQNDVNTEIGFIPCNLLEMLYAFVFSQEYGVAESGERYPVTFTARFNAMRDSLFTTPFRVAIRNGVDGAWTDSFGADFASVPNVSLWRT